MVTKGGLMFMTFLMHMNDFINANKEHPVLGPSVIKLEKVRDKMTEVVMSIQKAGAEQDFMYPVLNATPFLDLFGTVVLGFFLADQAVVASLKLDEILAKEGIKDDSARRKLIKENPEARFYDGKLHNVRFFADTWFPHVFAQADAILANNRSPLDIVF